jgi:hypothetical protein
VEIVEPRWAGWSFLLYAGGLTILGATLAALSTVSDDHGHAALAGWALVLFAASAAVALLLRRDAQHPVAAGIAAVIAVSLFTVFVGSLLSWAGWLDDGDALFRGFDLARLTLFLAALVAALVALRAFRFPLLVQVAASSGWLFVTDLLSGGGNWSATVSFLVGLAFLAVAVALDTGDHHPYAFWLHVAAGLAIGGSLVWFLHDGDFEWALIAVGGLLYVALADRFLRSSWAVLGAVGILMSAAHFAAGDLSVGSIFFGETDLSSLRSSIVFGGAGLILMLLGGLLARRNAARQRAIA